MLHKGAARKVTIFVNEDTQHHFGPLADAILTFLLHKGVAGATATRATAGFGLHRAMHSTRTESQAEHLPVRIEFIDSAETVDQLMPTLYDMVTDGVIEVQDTHIVKAANRAEPAPKAPRTEWRGTARLMRIFMGESDRWQHEPLYEAVLKRLRLMGIAGATVYRGILGYGAKGHTHKAGSMFAHDLPIVVSVVDTADKLREAIDAVEEMMDDGMIVLSDVEVIRLVRGPVEASDANR